MRQLIVNKTNAATFTLTAFVKRTQIHFAPAFFFVKNLLLIYTDHSLDPGSLYRRSRLESCFRLKGISGYT